MGSGCTSILKLVQFREEILKKHFLLFEEEIEV